MIAWPRSLAARVVGLGVAAGLGCAVAVSIRFPMAWSQGLRDPRESAKGDISAPPATAPPGLAQNPQADDGEDNSDASAADGPRAPADLAKRGQWLTTELDRLCSAGALPAPLATARIGAAVVDTATGTTLWAHQSDAAMNLASNAKVLTATAALQTLGTGFRWQTAALIAPGSLSVETGVLRGDLYLWGNGDPTLGAGDLRQMAHELAVAGVRSISGSVVVDASWFDSAVEPPHFEEQPTERAGFRAPIAAVTIERSSISVVIDPDPRAVSPAKVHVEPPAGDYVRVSTAEVVTIRQGRPRVRVDVVEKEGFVDVSVTGSVRSDEGTVVVRRRIDDPVRLAQEAFRVALNREGIRVARKPQRGRVPANAVRLASRLSPPLGDVVREMNKTSDNFLAEVTLKTMGAVRVAAKSTLPAPTPAWAIEGGATWEDGLAVVRESLVACGLLPGSFRIGNGSGLFAATAMSAAQLTQVLTCADSDFRVGPDLVASLAVGGADGTLARRWVGSTARGRVRAKTGTLAAVSTLAGFAGVDSRRRLAFAILVNDIPPGGRPAARQVQDAIVEHLIAYSEVAP